MDLSPVLTNQGDINTTAFIKVAVPTISGSPAYEYEVDSSWTEVDEYIDGNKAVVIYGYGSASELSVVEPGASTDALMNAATLKSTITGAQFNVMSDIDIDFDGYLVDAEVGSVGSDVWSLVPVE